MNILIIHCTELQMMLTCIVSDEAMHGRELVRSYRVVQPFPLLCVVVSARHLQHACMTHHFSTPTSRKQPKGTCPWDNCMPNKFNGCLIISTLPVWLCNTPPWWHLQSCVVRACICSLSTLGHRYGKTGTQPHMAQTSNFTVHYWHQGALLDMWDGAFRMTFLNFFLSFLSFQDER